jgi:hypothetical protein
VRASATRVLGTFSPKNTTSGFSMPPQASQAGTVNSASSSSISASPSGAARSAATRNPGLTACSVCWMASRANRAPQSRHTTPSIRPCSAIVAALPARSCRPSTFCVAMRWTRCRASSRASAACAAFGRAPAISGHPAMLRRQ